MERTTSLSRAKEIMGNNFIGPVELKSNQKQMGIYIPDEVLNEPPSIQFDEESLEKLKNDYILILGIPYYRDKTPLTIVKMREHFGWEPEKSEPCFYNQDWYLNEYFAVTCLVEKKWYLISKSIIDTTRGIDINKTISCKSIEVLPSALLVTYTFFCTYIIQNKILWEHEYIWCKDLDHNRDRIYVGRYNDNLGMNKNGFSVHRHLSITNQYGLISLQS